MMKRREFLGLTALTLLPLFKKAFAKSRTRTPSQMEGPYYPVKPIASENNLILDHANIAGKTMQLTGQVLDQQGQTLSGIRVEIWQCDNTGLYDHPLQPDTNRFDPSFAGAGADLTDSQGRYQFQTLYPVPYTGRPPHIHVKLWRGKHELLTTQLYLHGQTGSEWFSRGREALQISPVTQDQGNLYAEFIFVV